MHSLILIAVLSVMPGDNWPAFRGSGDSRTSATQLPVLWSETENVAWRADVPGYGQASPVVWGKRVFVTSMDGPTKEHAIVTCISLQSGKKEWQQRVASTQRVKVSGYVSRGAPTPVVDGNSVYAFFESGDLLALDHKGKIKWQRSLVKDYGPFKGNHGLGSSLVQSKDFLFVLVAHDGPSYLCAINKRTGKTEWKADREKKVTWTSPVFTNWNGKSQLLVSCGGKVESLSAVDGKRIWYVEGIDSNNVPSPTVDGDSVVIAASTRGSNVLLKLGGQGNVTESHIAWRAKEATSSFGSPLVHRGHVYFVNRTGVAFCLDRKTGRQMWKHRLGDSCWASPVGAGENVFFFTKGGKTIVVEHGPTLKVLQQNQLKTPDRVYGVAAVHANWIIRTGSSLTCIRAKAK